MRPSALAPLPAAPVASPEEEARGPCGSMLTVAASARLRGVFEDNYAFIWRILRRIGVTPGAVNDAAQQVFLVATRKIDQIAEGSERAFLFSTAMRTAAEARRSQATRRETPSEDLDDEAHPSPTPEELCERKRKLDLLDAILGKLPVELRTVFVLFEIEGLSIDEIVPLLSLPRGTVASRLRRAREEFQAISRRVRAKSTFEGDAIRSRVGSERGRP
jgi:RNA polymerase sigma-70 factor (ECF subfamily)